MSVTLRQRSECKASATSLNLCWAWLAALSVEEVHKGTRLFNLKTGEDWVKYLDSQAHHVMEMRDDAMRRIENSGEPTHNENTKTKEKSL